MPKVVYSPEGGEVREWDFDPRRLMSPERVAIEKLTGMDWGQWKAAIARDNTSAWHALLWVLLRRDDYALRPEAVEFCEADIEVTVSDAEKRETIAYFAANPEQLDDPEAKKLLEQFRADVGGESPKAKRAKK